MSYTFALVGNPNSGKTTLFNQLTGNHQHVGNWPGVTVEKKTGHLRTDESVEFVDLPGIYSLLPYSSDEMVARRFLEEGDPDAIIDIVDASNLERNLYLTTQLMEFGVPVIVALNQMDIVRKRGYTIKSKELSKVLGVPVVEISALKNEGISELVKLTVNAADKKELVQPVRFCTKLENYLMLNYSVPGISNLWVMSREIYSQGNRTNQVEWVDEVLSGKRKWEWENIDNPQEDENE